MTHNIAIITRKDKKRNKINNLLGKYSQYIKNNKIDDDNYRYINIDILKKSINKYGIFLAKHAKYNNITYIYFRGLYYLCKEKYETMMKLYLHPDVYSHNNPYIICMLGIYYNVANFNYENMCKYYLLAIELNSRIAANNLGYYYYSREKNIEKAIVYYKIGADLGCPNCLLKLGVCFNNYNKELATEYYLKGFEKLDSYTACNLQEYNNIMKIIHAENNMKNDNHNNNNNKNKIDINGHKSNTIIWDTSYNKVMYNLGYYYYNVGLYYQNNNANLKEGYFAAMKYYKIASNLNCFYAMHAMGYYYEIYEVNYVLAEKYYLMASKFNYVYSCFNIGILYQNSGNHTAMKKYYNRAIECGSLDACANMGNYYNINEPNFTLMKKYYMLGISKKQVNCMLGLGYYYEKNGYYRKMELYYLMAVEMKSFIAMRNLGDYYMRKKRYRLMRKYYIMAIEHGDKVSIAELKLYCKLSEGNILNYYKYLYYPRILALIIWGYRHGTILPEEIWNVIYGKYLQI